MLWERGVPKIFPATGDVGHTCYVANFWLKCPKSLHFYPSSIFHSLPTNSLIDRDSSAFFGLLDTRAAREALQHAQSNGKEHAQNDWQSGEGVLQ